METKIFKIDPTHSNIGFNVKHMMFSKVRGNFDTYEASVEMTGNDFETAKLRLEADAHSVNTNNKERDNHLRSADFFNSDSNKKIVFESTDVKKKGSDYVVTGNLTVNGVTKPVDFTVEYSGVMKDPWGNDRIALVIDGKMNREEWGITYNAALETGGVLVGKDVKFEIDAQFV